MRRSTQGHEGAEKAARAHEAEQHDDQRRRGASRLCEDDQHEHHGLKDEVAAGHQQRRSAEERLAPEPDQKLETPIIVSSRRESSAMPFDSAPPT